MAEPILTITCSATLDGFRWTIADRHGCKAERDTSEEIVRLALEVLEAWKKEKDEADEVYAEAGREC